MPPFDIAASGVPTTAPNKVGSMGEIQAGSVNDTASSLSPFGPGNNVAQKGLDNLNNEVRNFDFSDMKSQLQNVANDAQSFLAGLFNSLGRGADLKYPLEASNPAYQARVTFRMVAMKGVTDAESLKRFAKIATDNLKTSATGAAKSEDTDKDNTYLMTGGLDDAQASTRGVGGNPNAGLDEAGGNIPATGAQATRSSTSLSGQLGELKDAGVKKLFGDKKTANKIAKDINAAVSGGLKPVELNEPVVDMYFPLTMQFNDNAQYDNAALNALGGAAEGLLQQGAGALEATLGAALEGGKSVFDVIQGNKDLREAGLRVGAARLIDKVSVFNSGLANALTLQNRTIINPNIRALFRGVGLREFTFQFKMIAKSQAEARVIKDIVKHFRKQLYPDTYDITSLGGASIGFKFPNMFDIEFTYRGVRNRNIPKIHLCYLRNVSTTINPTGGAFRRDGQPNEVDLTLSFVEHKTLRKKDIIQGF